MFNVIFSIMYNIVFDVIIDIMISMIFNYILNIIFLFSIKLENHYKMILLKVLVINNFLILKRSFIEWSKNVIATQKRRVSIK